MDKARNEDDAMNYIGVGDRAQVGEPSNNSLHDEPPQAASAPPVEVCGLTGESFNLHGCRKVGSVMAKVAIRRNRLANHIVILDPTSGREMGAGEDAIPAVQFFVVNEADALADIDSTLLNLLLHAEQGDRASCSRLLDTLKTLEARRPAKTAEAVLGDVVASHGAEWRTIAKTLLLVGVPGGPAFLRAAVVGFADGIDFLLDGDQPRVRESDQESGRNMSATDCQAHMLETTVDRVHHEDTKASTMPPEDAERRPSMVGKLLVARADPNYTILGKNRSGEDCVHATPLTLAAFLGNTNAVAQLLESAANVNLAVDDGFTALILATAGGHTNLVELLITARANIDDGMLQLSPLKVERDETDVAAKAPARPIIEYENREGDTALTLAVSNGHVHAMDTLLAAGASVDHANGEGETALTLAIYEGRQRHEWKEVFSQVSSNYTALMRAASRYHITTVEKLLLAKANVNHVSSYGDTALTLAGGILVEKLLAAGANPNLGFAGGYTPLMEAVDRRNGDNVDKLLAARANIHHVNVDHLRGFNSLMLAASEGRKELVSKLLAHGANVHQAERGGGTALSFAVCRRHGDIVDELLASGASVDQANHEGDTPLLDATKRGDHCMVEKLLTAQSAVNHANKAGNTPLIIASAKGDARMVQKFIAAGANTNHALPDGETALICAISYDNCDIVDQLIAAGANINHAQRDGKTAFSIASENGNAGMVDKLVTAGAAAQSM